MFNYKEESYFDFLYQLFLGKTHCGNPLQNFRNRNSSRFSACQRGWDGCVRGLRLGQRRAPTSDSGEGLFHKRQGHRGYIHDA